MNLSYLELSFRLNINQIWFIGSEYDNKIAWVQILSLILYSSQPMKQRVAYSPKNQKPGSHLDINFKKSPQKFMLYQSHNLESHTSSRQVEQPFDSSHKFDHLRKVSDQVSSLRQTMNHKLSSKLAKRHTLYDFQQQDQKPNKLNDFLRQTMSYRSTKAYSQKFASQFTNSNQVTLRKDDVFNTYKSLKSQQSYRITQSRSSSNLLEHQKNLDHFELLQSIDQKKRLIEELRKPKQREGNYLKNVNYGRSPTYLDLDREKQIDEKGFRKKKNEATGQFMTPKLSKGTYDIRFNSDNHIQHRNKETKNEDLSSLIEIPTNRKKSSLTSTIKSAPIDDYEIGKKLGEGKFGCVNIVRHKHTFGLFALKKIPKAMIKSHMMVDQLALEIRLQSCLQHRNILGMYGFFDDKTHLYIVLEFMDGGTLYQQLKKGKLSQKDTALVIRQITQAIDYLHDRGIAHRDLKPENIVISNAIYKLCDFGWAAMCNERRKTYCGTFDYVAPEILEGVDYDMTVDLWCLGVMTFQLMTGKAPFYHISRKETMKRIKNVQNQTLQYPQGMSEQARDFIDKLIKKNPNERMKASDALEHPFIRDVDFVNL